MAWGRVLDVYAGTDLLQPIGSMPGVVRNGDKDNVVKLVGRDASTGAPGLDCEVTCTRSNRMRKNEATVTIWNLNREMRAWLQNPKMLLRIDAGYMDDGFGSIFYGAFGHAQSTKEGGDWKTVITAHHFRSLSMAFETLYFSVSYDPGTKLGSVLKDLQQILGVVVLGIDLVKDVVLDGGYADAGVMRKMLKWLDGRLRSIGYSLFYDLAEIIVYKVGTGSSVLDQTYVDTSCGLLKAEYVIDVPKESRLEARSAERLAHTRERIAYYTSADGKFRADQYARAVSREPLDQYKVEDAKRTRAKLETLVLHTVRPNSIIRVDHSAVKGQFSVDDIEYHLTNFGQPFDMKLAVSTDEELK